MLKSLALRERTTDLYPMNRGFSTDKLPGENKTGR